MTRRNLTYAALIITSLVVSACAQPTAPTASDTTCRGVYMGSSSNCGGT